MFPSEYSPESTRVSEWEKEAAKPFPRLADDVRQLLVAETLNPSERVERDPANGSDNRRLQDRDLTREMLRTALACNELTGNFPPLGRGRQRAALVT